MRETGGEEKKKKALPNPKELNSRGGPHEEAIAMGKQKLPEMVRVGVEGKKYPSLSPSAL